MQSQRLSLLRTYKHSHIDARGSTTNARLKSRMMLSSDEATLAFMLSSILVSLACRKAGCDVGQSTSKSGVKRFLDEFVVEFLAKRQTPPPIFGYFGAKFICYALCYLCSRWGNFFSPLDTVKEFKCHSYPLEKFLLPDELDATRVTRSQDPDKKGKKWQTGFKQRCQTLGKVPWIQQFDWWPCPMPRVCHAGLGFGSQSQAPSLQASYHRS